MECAWNSLSGEDYAILQDLYDKEEFYLKYPDNKGIMVTKIMYGGTLKGQVYRKRNNIPTLWTNITMNFIEKRR